MNDIAQTNVSAEQEPLNAEGVQQKVVVETEVSDNVTVDANKPVANNSKGNVLKVDIDINVLLINMFHQMVRAAEARKTLTYEMITRENGFHLDGIEYGHFYSPLMERIAVFCQQRGLPPLIALVVRKSGAERGIPGNVFWKKFCEAVVEDALESGDADVYVGDVAIVRDHGLVKLTLGEKRVITNIIQKQVFDFYSFEDM